MATTPRKVPLVKVTERLWSEEVARADPPDQIDRTEKAYEFTKPGRTFVQQDRDRYKQPDE